MLGRIFAILVLSAFLCAIFTGNVAPLGVAVLDGASSAVRVVISLAGMMGLWCGVMRVLTDMGIIAAFARLLRPFLRLFFPDSYDPERGGGEIAANLAANLLGIGNAATPMALTALRKMQENNPDKSRPTRDMVTLTVINTAPISLLPTTILALRRAAGASDPFAVVLPIWVTSTVCHVLALVLSRVAGSVADIRKNVAAKGRRTAANRRDAA